MSEHPQREDQNCSVKALIKQFLLVLHLDKHSGTQSGTRLAEMPCLCCNKRDDECDAAFLQVTAYLMMCSPTQVCVCVSAGRHRG